MPVKYLELENFKSYAGFQRIGPFYNCTCVVGPNGSGKSNLMDAISFILGVQSRDLRSSQLKDLIFRPPDADPDKISKLKASASLIYVNPEKDDEETKFGRTISSSGTGEYKINNRTVTFATYEARLGEIGVLIKVRNFLIFQGDVESIARKTPKELVEMFERISGSIDLRAEYEEALKAKDEAESETVFAFNKQKGYKSERRQLKEQKEEAERFNNKLQEKNQLQTEFYLWQLFHIQESIVEKEQETGDMKSELELLESAESERNSELKSAKKKLVTTRRALLTTEKQRAKLVAEVDAIKPGVISSSEEIKNLEKKIASDEKAIKKLEKDAEKHSEKIETLQNEINNHREEELQMEKEYEDVKEKGAAAEGTQALTEEQEAQYEQLKEAAAVASAKSRTDLSKINRKIELERAGAAGIQTEMDEVQARKNEATQAIAQLNSRKEILEQSLSRTGLELKNAEEELKSVQNSSREAQNRKVEIDQELEKINATLRDVRDDRRRNKDEERMLSAIASLKRNFQGVHGRLVDLCRPTQRRFNLAVTVAGGKDMDAIVVDTKNTGFECIQYLREQRVGTATFLPLDSLQVPPPSSIERIRSYAANDGRFRLCVDVIACDENIKRAVLYAVGNTIVCDDIDVAREICFPKRGSEGFQERMKAVTVGGAVISKAGTMTGGVTKEDSSRAGRFDDRELDKLRDVKEKLETERASLDSYHSEALAHEGRSNVGHTVLIEDLRNKLGNLRSRHQYTKSDLAYTINKQAEQESLLSATTKQLSSLNKTMNTIEKSINNNNKQAKVFTEKVKEAEDKVFAQFRDETGIVDFHAYEEVMGRAREDFLRKRRQIREKITKLISQKEYEDSRDFRKPIAKHKKLIKDKTKALNEAKEFEQELLKDIASKQEKLADVETALAISSKEEKDADAEVQTAQKAFGEAQTAKLKQSKVINNEENSLERIRGKLHEILQKARVEEVDLPMQEETARAKRRRRGEPNEEQLPSDMSEEEEEDTEPLDSQESNNPHFSQKDDRRVKRDMKATGKIFFEGLRPNLKRKPNDREEKKIRNEFEQQIAKCLAELEGMAPNMKANEAFDNVVERLKESSSAFESSKAEARNATLNFNRIKAERSQRFKIAFDHIDEALKIIYKDMTKSSKHPLGGNAYLSLDDADEPYQGGMKFNAMPPLKRFRDMEQLSGGEKTVAALSLLFAIHSFRPAPFFVMDEVDAALDNVNVLKVCNYVRQCDFQCIVISLKDLFYQRSESLVGICRHVQTNSSRTLTLDLRKFDSNEEEEEDDATNKRSLALVEQ